jgi:predicted nucleic acid-binding protein
MIAADTSAWIDYAKGLNTSAAALLELALSDGILCMPSPVLFEVLSGPGITKDAAENIRQLPKLELNGGFWERAGEMRRMLLARNLRARAMDCLIAQNCLDHEVPLIAADQDFRHFTSFGLKLAKL